MPKERIAKRENELKTSFWKMFEDCFRIDPRTRRRCFFVMQHQDVRKSGFPDTSVHGYGKTTHWEFKHATPNFATTTQQELTCSQLAKFAHCRYVIFFENVLGERYTQIVHPEQIFGSKGSLELVDFEIVFDDFSFGSLASYIASIHNP